MALPKLVVGFDDFWPSFDPMNNFFVHVLSDAFEVSVCLDHSVCVDLLVYSVFGSHFVHRRCKKRVYYTGENCRPVLEHADLSVSFDRIDDPRHARIPLYILYTDWYGRDPDREHVKPHVYSQAGRRFHEGQKDAVMVMCSNGAGFRMHLLPELLVRLSPDRAVSLGNVMRTPGYSPVPVGDKLEHVAKYKLNLAIENSQHPGYLTEKILQAYAGNAIPCYHGDPTVMQDFNPDSFLNLNGMTATQAVDAIEALLNDPDRMDRMLAEPPMRSPPDLKAYVAPIIRVAADALRQNVASW